VLSRLRIFARFRLPSTKIRDAIKGGGGNSLSWREPYGEVNPEPMWVLLFLSLAVANIPTINLAEDGSTKSGIFARAMRDFGCIVVTGHGIDLDLIRNLRFQTKRFFELPLESKMTHYSGSYGSTGYSPIYTEAVDASSGKHEKTPDPVESFYLRNEAESSPELEYLFSAAFAYRTALEREVVLPILQLAAQALEIQDPNAFVNANDFAKREASGMFKLSHYPPQSQAATRYGGHTDWEGFTFLLPDEQDDALNGLELYLPNETRWQAVGSVPPYAIIVNAGDFVPLWTEGRWHSPLHRVTLRDPDRDRFAFPYFVGPLPDSQVQSLLSAQHNSSALRAGEWLQAKFHRVQTEL